MAEQGVRHVRPRSWFALTLVALTGAGCTPMDDLLVSIFGRSMRDQPSILAYENPQILPPEGAVPFAAGNFPAAPGEYGMNQSDGVAIPVPITPLMVLMATEDPTAYPDVAGFPNPVPADAGSLVRGEELYIRACVACHGVVGAGDGTVVAAGVPSRSIVAPETMAYTDAYIYSIIRVGRGAMPAYGHQISHFDRWHLVNYVRQLQGMLPAQTGAGMAPSDNAAPAADGDAPDA